MLLADYEIHPANRRFSNGTQRRGYARADFTDAWNRYCPLPDNTNAAGRDTQVGPVPLSAAMPKPPGLGLPVPPPSPGTGPRR